MKIKTNLKAFTTYGVTPGLMARMQRLARKTDGDSNALESVLSVHETLDPTGSMWGTQGYANVAKDQFAMDLDGKAILVGVQFNDRILPSATIKERMADEIAAIKEREGRKANKTEFAQVRDAAEAYLLPRSHIRRTIIPVIIYPTRVVIFTASAKRAGDVASMLFVLAQEIDVKMRILPSEGVDSSASWLTSVATGDDYSVLEPGASAVLRYDGEEKKTAIRIKDKDISASEVQALINESSYRVSELEVYVLEGAETPQGLAGVQFSINDKLVVKGLKFPDMTIKAHLGETDGDAAAEAHGIYTLLALTVPMLLQVVFQALGGEKRDAFVEEDDEL